MSGLRRLFQTARERNSLTWMDIYWQGGLYASQSGRGLLTVVKEKSFFSQHVYWLNSICCAICADRDRCSRVCVFPAGFGSNFRIMVGSASGLGSTFKAFLGSARVRVPLSNKIRVRVGSVQHIYGSLRVRVRIFGPVKTSTLHNHRSTRKAGQIAESWPNGRCKSSKPWWGTPKSEHPHHVRSMTQKTGQTAKRSALWRG